MTNSHFIFTDNPTLQIFILVYFAENLFRGTFLIGFAYSVHIHDVNNSPHVWVNHMFYHVVKDIREIL